MTRFDSPVLRALLLPMACAVLLLSAPSCAKTETAPASSPADPTAAKPPAKVVEKPKDVSVTGIHIGSGVGEYDHVAVEKTTFAPHDKIAVSVYSDGWAKTAKIGVRWMNAKGAVLAEEARDVNYNGSLATLFQFEEPKGLPAGTYTIEVRLNDWLAGTEHFDVK